MTYLMFAIVVLGVGLTIAPLTGGVEIQAVEQPRVMAFVGADVTNAIVSIIGGLAHPPLLIFLCALCGLALLGRRHRPTSGPDGHSPEGAYRRPKSSSRRTMSSSSR